MTVCSLNEIQVYGMRAARGAGMTWGLAEEAGGAARWLAARGLSGPQSLACLLRQNDSLAFADIAPQPGEVWRARSGALCPICTGSAIADALGTFDDTPLRLGKVSYPLLLLPFLAVPHAGACFVLSWDETRVTVDSIGYRIRAGDDDALTIAATTHVSITPDTGSEPLQQIPPSAGGIEVPDDGWLLLQAFAHRIYVPASEASRSKGAGARGSDND